MSTAAHRSARRLAIGLAAALAVALGTTPSLVASDQTESAGTLRPAPAPGPNGLDSQHNETLVRDAS